MTKVRWTHGATTIPGRSDDLLPRTLASLKAAGFVCPGCSWTGPSPIRWRSTSGGSGWK
jgi:hypothetical protein